MFKYLTVIFLLCFVVELAAVDATSPKATLYYSDTCGHCKKVLSYLRQNPYPVTMKNIGNSNYRRELQSMGHRGVPVLISETDSLTGADSIISYFRAHSR